MAVISGTDYRLAPYVYSAAHGIGADRGTSAMKSSGLLPRCREARSSRDWQFVTAVGYRITRRRYVAARVLALTLSVCAFISMHNGSSRRPLPATPHASGFQGNLFAPAACTGGGNTQTPAWSAALLLASSARCVVPPPRQRMRGMRGQCCARHALPTAGARAVREEREGSN